MAFEWNWKGSQNAYDAYKTAEDLASQRYWANRDYIDAQNQAIADQYAAQGVRGVANPAPVYAQPNLGQAQYAYQQALANAPEAYAAQQAQAQQDALRAELAQNEQRIAQIKLEIAQLKGESGRAWDALDMQLAANRANAGDIGNAIAHQNRIVTRQQLANANGSKSASDAKAEELVKEYITTESMMMMGDNKARPGYQNQLRYLKYQIDKDPKAKKLLAKFNGSFKTGDNEDVKTFQDFQNLVSDLRTANANNTSKKNGLTKSDKEAIDEYWYSLPKEVREANKEAYNTIRGEDDIESIQARGAKKLAKQKAALAEAKKNIRRTDLDKSGSYDYTATNGETVNVKRSSFGKAVFNIGKLTETVDY